jgi:hypothetical protein
MNTVQSELAKICVLVDLTLATKILPLIMTQYRTEIKIFPSLTGLKGPNLLLHNLYLAHLYVHIYLSWHPKIHTSASKVSARFVFYMYSISQVCATNMQCRLYVNIWRT